MRSFFNKAGQKRERSLTNAPLCQLYLGENKSVGRRRRSGERVRNVYPSAIVDAVIVSADSQSLVQTIIFGPYLHLTTRPRQKFVNLLRIGRDNRKAFRLKTNRNRASPSDCLFEHADLWGGMNPEVLSAISLALSVVNSCSDQPMRGDCSFSTSQWLVSRRSPADEPVLLVRR